MFLLKVFEFYVDEDMDENFRPSVKQSIEEWIALAHVCRRWRSVVFQSPRRLNLRLICTRKTPASDTLDICPPLPLTISDIDDTDGEPPETKNIDAALEHNDRVCQIQLVNLSSSQVDCVTNSAAMQKPWLPGVDTSLAQRVCTCL
jgi:hypothetical protein